MMPMLCTLNFEKVSFVESREVVDLIVSKIKRSIEGRLVDGSAVAWQIASDGYKVLCHNWWLL